MSFLPEGYEVPSASTGYMKFNKGVNKFRVLSSATLGVEVWTTENKPVRFRPDEKFAMKPEYKDCGKHFWACAVWNYQEDKIQILEITQKSIMNAVNALTRNQKWGSPFDYDLIVNREGEGLETQYTVAPDPKEELDPQIQEKYEAIKDNINVEALYEGADPFENV